MTRLNLFVSLCASLAAATHPMAAQVAVRVEPTTLQGPRSLEDQTRAAVIRDYLRAWQSFHNALDQNRPELLATDFVGTAKGKLENTVQEQQQLQIRSSYQDRSHNLKILFYSPDGMSIELIDNVEYDLQVMDHDKVITTQRESARYLVVLTPAEVRWKVRVFQSLLD